MRILNVFNVFKYLILKLIHNRKKKGIYPILEEEFLGYETYTLLSLPETHKNNQSQSILLKKTG